ncbi:MAG TPA: hypothetical protein VMV18_00440 [bacterium]|nr:hypothetical protein [bacterium]
MSGWIDVAALRVDFHRVSVVLDVLALATDALVVSNELDTT